MKALRFDAKVKKTIVALEDSNVNESWLEDIRPESAGTTRSKVKRLPAAEIQTLHDEPTNYVVIVGAAHGLEDEEDES